MNTQSSSREPRSRSPHHRRGRRGTATVEFAVVAPALIILIIGSLQLFRFYSVANTLELATMEGARRGILHGGSLAQAELATESYLEFSNIQNASIEISKALNESNRYEMTIAVNCPMSGNGFLVPFGQSLVIQRQARILCESQ